MTDELWVAFGEKDGIKWCYEGSRDDMARIAREIDAELGVSDLDAPMDGEGSLYTLVTTKANYDKIKRYDK